MIGRGLEWLAFEQRSATKILGLAVEREGVEVTDARTDFDDTALYMLARQLNKNAKERGECWRSFVMSYRRGGQVKTSFNYDEK